MEAEERARPGTDEADRPSTGAPVPSDGARADERSDPRVETLAANERCAHHAGRQAVTRCVVCGEPVCLACAVPVRGRVLGPGCVAAELGDPALVAPPDGEVNRPWISVAGALVALVGTVAPWTRTGAGDRLFGAWVMNVRWSSIAAVAAVILLWLAWRSRGRTDRAGALVALLAGTVVISAVLAIVFPPTFQTASWGPWLTASGAALAGAGGLLAVRSGRDRTQGV